MELFRIMEVLRLNLDDKRFHHCVRVAEEACKLAIHYKSNPEKAFLAGLLHDCAKACSSDKILEIADSMKINLTDVERSEPFVMLHGQVSAYIAENTYEIKDREVLQSIYRHQCVASDMTVLDNIIKLADIIEPGRMSERAQKVRELAYNNIAEALLCWTRMLIVEMIEKEFFIEPNMAAFYNQLLLQHANSIKK